MSFLETELSKLYQWLSINYALIIESIIFSGVIYVFYKGFSRQVNNMKKYVDETAISLINRFLRWGAIFIVISFSFNQLGIKVDNIVGFLVLASGTVFGFAAMNTLGNAIAGLILMFSKPFKIGDRLSLDGQFMDVVDIDLIFTRLKTPDNVYVSIPNQKLLQTNILDYGKDRVIRRRHTITASYGDSQEIVEKALLEAAEKISDVLVNPAPFVLVTDLQDFAVEHTLFVFVKESNRILEIDSAVRKAILIQCESHNIDLSTPSLIRKVE